MNECKTQAIYFSHRRRPVEANLTLKRLSIPFVNSIKYICVISTEKLRGGYRNDRRQTFRKCIITYPFEKWAIKLQHKINPLQSID
jgi:hypothetical protein